jgi:hypothetical protein
MEYVMVPVPEEILEDVQLFLRWQTDFARPGQGLSVERADVEAFVRGLDDEAEALLRQLAFPPPDVDLTFSDLAAALGSTFRETVGAVYELNVQLVDTWGGAALIAITPLTKGAPLHQRVIALPEPLAEPVRAVLTPTDPA